MEKNWTRLDLKTLYKRQLVENVRASYYHLTIEALDVEKLMSIKEITI